MTDSLTNWVAFAFRYGSSFSYNSNVIDIFVLFCKDLTSSKYEDVQFVLEELYLIGCQYLEERNGLVEDFQELAFLGFRRFAFFGFIFYRRGHYYCNNESLQIEQ